MKTKILFLFVIIFFMPVSCDKNVDNKEFIPQTITPVQIAQGVLYGVNESIMEHEMIIKTPSLILFTIMK